MNNLDKRCANKKQFAHPTLAPDQIKTQVNILESQLRQEIMQSKGNVNGIFK
ncbi:MAG: hypothetical protein HOP25_06310 [Methylotenera sp.]|nr:hypothetical protein [Methylotenera sp.]